MISGTWLAAGVALANVALALWIHRRVRRFVHAPPPAAPPRGRVRVVLPARNEAENLGAALDGLLAQDPPPERIVVVNDASEDDTGRIAEAYAAAHPGVEALHTGGPPPGWAGKVHAMTLGARGATGEWLAFVDADVRHGRGALAAMVGLAEREGLDLVSCAASPSRRSRPWDLVMPVGLQLLLSVASPDGRGPGRALAVGHFVLVKRSTYLRVGGYAAISGSLTDDVDFGTLVRDRGGRTRMVWSDGRLTSPQLTTWRTLWRSWRKSLAGVRDASEVSLLLAGTLLLAWAAAPPLLGLAFLEAGHLGGMALAALAWGAQCAARAGIDRRLGVPLSYTASGGMGALVFAGILLDASWRAASGRGSPWKGRTAP